MKHKEYLDSESDYMHVVFPDVPTIPKRYIEIPEGAEVLTKYNDEIIFWKENKYSFHTANSARWDDADDGLCTLSEYKQRYNSTILWQRHPENQEPLGDVKWFEGDLKEAELDKQLSNVDLTLLERQSQYGCFEDVAFVTQGIIALLRKCNYDNMPQPHQMALYMIASKMARLVNGDHNHIDGWHDIGGYSKLIENLIGGENE